jgi:hypothetical protein
MLHKPEIVHAKMASKDLSNLGIDDMAYIKAVMVDGEKLHAIHAADGTPLSVVSDRNLAFATVSQHDMQPMSVH